MIGWDPWIKKSFYYLNCIEGKGVWKTFTVLHKIPRFLLIYYEISFESTVWVINWHLLYNEDKMLHNILRFCWLFCRVDHKLLSFVSVTPKLRQCYCLFSFFSFSRKERGIEKKSNDSTRVDCLWLIVLLHFNKYKIFQICLLRDKNNVPYIVLKSIFDFFFITINCFEQCRYHYE